MHPRFEHLLGEFEGADVFCTQIHQGSKVANLFSVCACTEPKQGEM
jgi:hypothetical protein